MRNSVAIIYSSVDGQTKKISEKLKSLFESRGLTSELYSIHDLKEDLGQYHTLVLGASIRYGKHNEKVLEFISRNRSELKKLRTAFFSVNLVARNSDKNSADSNPYLIKFLEKTAWRPDFVEVFAGKLDYSVYSFVDRVMIKLIMLITKGPTKSKKPIEYTDWDRVESFGLKLISDCENSKAS